jgi:ferredoxin
MTESVGETLKLVRFMQGAKLLGQTRLVLGETLVEHAESAGVSLPTNCTSGTCGTCMVTLVRGKIPVPEILPPGLDDYLIEQEARLGCIGCPTTDCDIDIRPPL